MKKRQQKKVLKKMRKAAFVLASGVGAITVTALGEFLGEALESRYLRRGRA